MSKDEKQSLIFRRSIYVSENMHKGEILTENKIRIIRPGLGLSPKYYDILIGKKINKDVKKGTPFDWSLIS